MSRPATGDASQHPPIQLLPVEKSDTGLGSAGKPATTVPAKSGAHPADPAEPAASGWGHFAGLLLVLAGAVLATLPAGRWGQWLEPAGDPWTSETCRWLLAGVLIIGGVSFLRSRPIFFLMTSALVMLTAYCVDMMLGRKLSAAVDLLAGQAVNLPEGGIAGQVWPVGSLALGYLIHLSPRAAKPSLQGMAGLVLVAFAALGAQQGWYERFLQSAAPKIGPGIVGFVSEWSEECTWAVALVLAAIGVASSRTKPVHFLIAILLGAMAYHCVQAGAARLVTFPNVNGINIPDIETLSLRNVPGWRWVAAGELVLLGLILLHLSLGVGALNVAFALTWMAAGLAGFQEVGKLAIAKEFGLETSRGAAMAGAPGSPLATWGLPLTPPSGRHRSGAGPSARPPAPSGPMTPNGEIPSRPKELPTARTQARTDENGPVGVGLENAAARQTQAVVEWAVPLSWIYLTAILAGVIGVAGFRLLSTNEVYRGWVTVMLWFVFGLGCAWLWAKWPRDPEQSWLKWVATFGFSRYYEQIIWLVFVGCMAVCGIWALRGKTKTVSWIHASIYCTFLGTILTLVAVAVLIRFGGFGRLPMWTYVAIAAGQSSLAWVLMMHLSLADRSGSSRDIIE